MKRIGFVSVLVLALSLTACTNSDRKPVFPVQGKVIYRGKPATGARVIFHPQDEDGPQSPRPSADVQPDGSFRLSTYVSQDGAPPGRYAVTIFWPSATRIVDTENAGPDQLQGRYSNHKTTPIRVEIMAGANVLETFKLE